MENSACVVFCKDTAKNVIHKNLNIPTKYSIRKMRFFFILNIFLFG